MSYSSREPSYIREAREREVGREIADALNSGEDPTGQRVPDEPEPKSITDEAEQKTYGGFTLEQLAKIRAAAVKGRRLGLTDKLHPHGPYLSLREDISRSVEHLDEIAQRHSGAPFQALPINREEDAAALATAYNAMPDLLAEIERLQAQVKPLRDALEHARKYAEHKEDTSEVCYDWCPSCRIEAALNRPHELARPLVKPLEWEDFSTPGTSYQARALGRVYEVWLGELGKMWHWVGSVDRGTADSLEAVKAACEAHWQSAMKEYLRVAVEDAGAQSSIHISDSRSLCV